MTKAETVSSERVQEIAREDGDSSGVEVRSMASELLARRMRDEAAEQMARSLRPFLGDKDMEAILWGDLPDDATGSVSVSLADFRNLRAALEEWDRRVLTEWKETEPS